MTKRPETKTIPRAVDLIEEGVHLLRAHPGALGLYYAGAAPFACGIVFFWAYVSWFMPADGAVAFGALGLALAFGLMRATQHRYAQALRAHLVGDALPRWRLRDWGREGAAQLRLQALGVVVLPLAAAFTVPFGWAYAYFQSAIVLPGEGRSAAERRQTAWEQAQLWPAQNHWGIAILSVLWAMVFVNLAVAFVVVPMLATRWLGLHTVFALSGWSYFSTTFLVTVAVLTHLAVGPLIKAFYVVRVFRGEARRSGADLLLVLRREQARRSAARAGLAVLALAVSLASGMPAARAVAAVPAPTPAATVSPQRLDRALDDVLARPDFRWRLRPVPETGPQKKKEGIITGFLRATFETAREIVRSVSRGLDRAKRWVADLLPGGKDDKAPTKPRDSMASLRWMDLLQFGAYALLAIVAGLLLWVVWKVFEHNRTRPLAGGATGALPTATLDLRDETVEASRLPAHEWLALARAKLAEGEWRLAWRALFLATIATHAHDGLLSLAKFKTNLDYERELRRRALGRAALAEEFRARREAFEGVWYGQEPASADAAREWLRQLEGPR